MNLVPGAKIILDIGANQGVYSLIAAGINKEAKIYAFEPYDTNANKIRKN